MTSHTSQPQLLSRPPFDALPLDPNGPPGNAWGLYGKDDQFGALNLLTPDVVAAAAAAEIRTGERVSLDWVLTKPSRPSFGRPPFVWKMLPNAEGLTINDDELAFNTQCSSQWDGFRHFGYQAAQRFYNNTSREELVGDRLGINVWLEKGGIVGRGVLLDYAAFCARHNIASDPFVCAAIPMEHIHQMATEQNLTFRRGDILFIRVGFTAAYDKLDADAQTAIALRPDPDFLGVEPSKAMLKWLWDNEFAAVAGDAPSFEQAPVRGHWRADTLQDHVKDGGMIHQVLLGGWGVPIGELFDLEKLSATCKRLQRWSFFISSMPLNVPGGVASPPNAVAIF
ncbi:hypothetical protein SEUCBS139899_006949 [Sporothrix eucalyptigena]